MDSVFTRRSGAYRLDVYKGSTRKGYVVSQLGAFSAFDTKGDRIPDGDNLMFDLRRRAIEAVAAH